MRTWITLIGLWTVVGVALTGTPSAPRGQVSSASTNEDLVEGLRPEKGRELVLENCVLCHSTAIIVSNHTSTTSGRWILMTARSSWTTSRPPKENRRSMTTSSTCARTRGRGRFTGRIRSGSSAVTVKVVIVEFGSGHNNIDPKGRS